MPKLDRPGTKTEFTARVGLTKGRISQLVADGLLVRPDGRIDVEAGLAWMEPNSHNAFGVYREEPFDVAWRFDAAAGEAARDYAFHREQQVEEQPDGSVVVRFRAGGSLEMAWHLYSWGDHVEVLEPGWLTDMVHPARRSWPSTP